MKDLHGDAGTALTIRTTYSVGLRQLKILADLSQMNIFHHLHKISEICNRESQQEIEILNSIQKNAMDSRLWASLQL